jgi:hypothetical protein
MENVATTDEEISPAEARVKGRMQGESAERYSIVVKQLKWKLDPARFPYRKRPDRLARSTTATAAAIIPAVVLLAYPDNIRSIASCACYNVPGLVC